MQTRPLVSTNAVKIMPLFKSSRGRHGVFATVAATALLGACSLPISQGHVYQTGVPNTFAYAAGGRDLTTIVVGNPFKQPKAEVDKAVTDAMQGHNQGPTTHFTTTPSDSARAGYRGVVFFNPPINLNSACDPISALSTGAGAATDGRLTTTFAFCSKETLLSEVNGSIPATADPQDTNFRQLLAQMTRTLEPNEDPFTKSDNCVPPGC